jgi:non-specific serine/threonine protein kinase/serine/threonine-protein kinase
LKALLNLAIVSEMEGHLDEATKLHEEALELRRRVFGPDHPDTLESMSNLGDAYSHTGRRAEAENLLRETLAARRRVLGPDHPDTLQSMNGLANFFDDEGRHAEAEALYRETIERRRRVLGPGDYKTLVVMTDLAEAYRGEARYADSEKVLKEALATQLRAPASDRSALGVILYGLGCTTARQGDREKALAYLRQALDQGVETPLARKLGTDPELRLLQGDPRFAALVEEAKKTSDKDAR